MRSPAGSQAPLVRSNTSSHPEGGKVRSKEGQHLGDPIGQSRTPWGFPCGKSCRKTQIWRVLGACPQRQLAGTLSTAHQDGPQLGTHNKNNGPPTPSHPPRGTLDLPQFLETSKGALDMKGWQGLLHSGRVAPYDPKVCLTGLSTLRANLISLCSF